MAEETLFSRDRDEAEGRHARIDRLFADAVERQMVEQRAFNRVIEDVGERLVSLESGLRSLWETTSSQGVALRSELQDGLANVAEDVDSRSRALTQEVERLRVSSPDHAARLGELAWAAQQAMGALGEGQARLAEKLAGLERNVAASTEHTANIPDLVAPQLQRLEAIVSEVEGHVRHTLESGIRELDERVASRDGGVDRRLEDLTRRVDEGMALLGQRLIAIEQRVDSHEEAVARTTSAAERLGGQVDAARDAVDESRDALAREIVNLSSRLRQALIALGEAAARDAAETREATAAAGDHLGEVATCVAKLEEHAAAIVETPSRTAAATIEVFRPFLEDFRSTLVDEQREELAASLRQVRAVTSGVTEEIEELQILAGALRQAQTGDEERLAAFRDDLLARVDGLLGSGLGDIRQRLPEVLSGHHQDLLGTLGQFEDAVAERLGVSEEAGRNLFAAIDERLRDAEREGRTLRAAIEERLDTAAEEGRVLRSAVEERLDLALDTLKERLGDMVGTVDERLPELSSHRADLLATLEQFEATVAQPLGVSQEEGRALLQALEERLGASAQEGRALRVAIEKRVDEAVSALEDRLEQVGIALDERLPEVLAGRENEVAPLQAALKAASERLDTADEIFRTAAGKLDDLAPNLASRIARALDRAVETTRSEAPSAAGELQTALARLKEIQATFTGLEGSLLAYLEAFDARLEQERARVLAKLGEELAEGLSRRERKRLVGWLGSAREADTRHEVSSSVPGSPPLPLSPEPKPESGPPDPAPSGPPRPSMRPGLLMELLGEEPPQDRPEPPVPGMLRPGGEVQTEDEERTEQAPPGQALDSDVAKPVGPAPDEVKSTSFICPTCGFAARSAAGLTSHRRRHA